MTTFEERRSSAGTGRMSPKKTVRAQADKDGAQSLLSHYTI